MAAAITDLVTQATNGTRPTPTTLTALKAIGAPSISVGALTGWPTATAVHFVIYTVDASGNKIAGSQTDWKGIASGTTISSLTLKAGTDNGYSVGAIVEAAPTAAWANDVVAAWIVDHTQLGYHLDLHGSNGKVVMGLTDGASTVNNLRATAAVTGAPPTLSVEGTDSNANMLVKAKGTGNVIAQLAAIQGFLINGKITASVASNNLTVAIKTLDGNDPSATNPVYIRIGDTVRTISAALSVTKNAGTNWFGKGASYFATNESDFFVYLVWNTVDSAVTIAFSSIPTGRLYSDFSTTTTNWNYFAGSGSAPNATDVAELIGRFNATLSATAAFNWSIPATVIVVNRPIFETRAFSFTNTGSSAGTFYWKQIYAEKRVWGNSAAIGNTTGNLTNPTGFFTTLDTAQCIPTGGYTNTNQMAVNLASTVTTMQTNFQWTPIVVSGTNPSNPYALLLIGT